MNEIYVSVDIEADGPIPGDNSMLSIGSAAYDESGSLLSTFSANILPLQAAQQNPITMEFWSKQPKAWAELQKDRHAPGRVMHQYHAWLQDISPDTDTSLVFVAYPAVFDFAYVHWYFIHFVGVDPFGFSALDLKTYAMATLNLKFSETYKSNMPKDWLNRNHPPHVALADAIEQGEMFFEIRKAIQSSTTE